MPRCPVLVGAVLSPAAVCPRDCVLAESRPSADHDAVSPTPAADDVLTPSWRPSHTQTQTREHT